MTLHFVNTALLGAPVVGINNEIFGFYQSNSLSVICLYEFQIKFLIFEALFIGRNL
jgi:hypothetical protein